MNRRRPSSPITPDDQLTLSERAADIVRDAMGSWTFIFVQTAVCILWVLLNLWGLTHHWDPYPFILLNLAFSVQAAFASPVILLAQKRADHNSEDIALHTYQNTLALQEAENVLTQELADTLRQVHQLTAEVHTRIVGPE